MRVTQVPYKSSGLLRGSIYFSVPFTLPIARNEYHLSPAVKYFKFKIKSFQCVVRVQKVIQPIVIGCKSRRYCYHAIAEYFNRLNNTITASDSIVRYN